MIDPIHMLPLLAARGGDFEQIFGLVIFFAIWLVGAAASAINKRAQKRKLQQARPPMPPPTHATPTPYTGVQRAGQGRKVAPSPQPPKRTPAAPPPTARQPQRGRVAKRVPGAPIPSVVSSSDILIRQIARSETNAISAMELGKNPRTGTVRQTGHANAASLRHWLRPDTLRSQFILTEILQTPVSLREDRRIL